MGVNSPLVSVIVPTFNRPAFLAEALRSLQSQTYPNLEIIVVNDGGIDVRHLCTDPRILYLAHKKSKGPSAARNTALKKARGKYISYLDDDDIFYPHHIRTLVAALEKGRLPIACSDYYRTWKEEMEGQIYTYSRAHYTISSTKCDQLLLSNNLTPSCLMHRKDCLNRTGLFDENLRYSEDWDLWIRLSRYFPFLHIRKITAEYTKHEGNCQLTGQWAGVFLNSMQTIHFRYKQYASVKIAESQKFLRFQKRGAAIQQLEEISEFNFDVTSLYRQLAKGSLLFSLDDVQHTINLGECLIRKLPKLTALKRIQRDLVTASQLLSNPAENLPDIYRVLI